MKFSWDEFFNQNADLNLHQNFYFNLMITRSRIMEIFFFQFSFVASDFLTSHSLLLFDKLSRFMGIFLLHLLLCLIHLSFIFNAFLLAAADANYERMVLRFFYINRITFYDLLESNSIYRRVSLLLKFFTFTAISFW